MCRKRCDVGHAIFTVLKPIVTNVPTIKFKSLTGNIFSILPLHRNRGLGEGSSHIYSLLQPPRGPRQRVSSTICGYRPKAQGNKAVYKVTNREWQ